MFTVRTARPAESPGSPLRWESAAFDLTPELEQGRAVCNLFAEFLAGQPAVFEESLPFLSRHDITLTWSAAESGSAFASFLHAGQPLSMSILLSGVDPESDEGLLSAMRDSILAPAGGGDLPAMEERPLVIVLQVPGSPELEPTVQLLTTALASVYFRAVLQMAAAADGADGGDQDV